MNKYYRLKPGREIKGSMIYRSYRPTRSGVMMPRAEYYVDEYVNPEELFTANELVANELDPEAFRTVWTCYVSTTVKTEQVDTGKGKVTVQRRVRTEVDFMSARNN